MGADNDQQVIRIRNYVEPDSSKSLPTIAEAVVATLAGPVVDRTAHESGGHASRILDAKAMAAETARAASKIWCSGLPALNSLLKAFVTIGASGTAASEAAGLCEIPQERYITFNVQQVNRDRFEICIDSLREKRSLSTPSLFLMGTLN